MDIIDTYKKELELLLVEQSDLQKTLNSVNNKIYTIQNQVAESFTKSKKWWKKRGEENVFYKFISSQPCCFYVYKANIKTRSLSESQMLKVDVKNMIPVSYTDEEIKHLLFDAFEEYIDNKIK